MSAGRLIVWRLALAELRGCWRQCSLPACAIAVLVVLLAVLPVPSFEAGLLIGVLVTAFVCILMWRIWVSSGLADRLHGTWAEDWTGEELRKSLSVVAVIPSLKFQGFDIDHVTITPAGVWAIETKFHRVPVSERTLAEDAYQAASAARTLRLSLNGRGLPGELVRPLLVLWGRGSREVVQSEVRTNKGPVVVVGGNDLVEWLSRSRTGPVGQDYAAELTAHLNSLAVARDTANVDAGRALSWLARTR